jgi:tetratricopeptide (TPR) repeat protein
MRVAFVWAMAALGTVAWPAASGARESKKETPGSERAAVVSQWAFERLERAHEALAEERFDDCLVALDEMKKNKRLNDHEKALMWQAYGYVYSSREEWVPATEAFEHCLEAGGLPEQADLNTRYNLAQLYLMLEQYDKAIPMLLDWFDRAENPSPAAYYALAVAYVQTGENEKARMYAAQAVLKSEAPLEPWLQLLLGFRLEDKQFPDAAALLEQLVTRFPKKIYWLQLSAVYSAMDESKKALVALELAHAQGLLTEEGELVQLAQLYFFNELPYEAAKVLEQGLRDGTITGDADAYELLANSWLYAKERTRAIDPLRDAAKRSPKGDLYVRLASVRLEQEQWDEAIRALQEALRKNLDDPATAHLMLGIAGAGAQQWDVAERALIRAQDYEKTEKAAAAWLTRLEHEKTIAAAGRAR